MTTMFPTIPSTPVVGFGRVIDARLQGHIHASGKTLAELEALTDISVDEFRAYFNGHAIWTCDDVALVCMALGIDVVALFRMSPAPSDMPVSGLVCWLRGHYGRTVRPGDVLDEFLDDFERSPQEEWVHLVRIADQQARGRARIEGGRD
ncbi:hypothetical protein [Nocardia beijingensis]|uniref:hypothetical protein n=1 Tax=Nocardia beijingensis TaxID=95162 RepID=UPI0033B119E9